MSILVVSTNPLFKEIITASIGQIHTELIELDPEVAKTKICELKPDVIIIDKTIIRETFEGLLSETRNLQKTRTIVLDPNQNEIILVNSRQTTMRKLDDLLEAIGSE